MSDQELLKKTEEMLRQLSAFDPNTLNDHVNADLSMLNARAYAARFHQLFEPLTPDVLQGLADDQLNLIFKHCQSGLNDLIQASRFREQEGGARRNEHLTAISTRYEDAQKNLMLLSTWGSLRKLNPDRVDRVVQDRIAEGMASVRALQDDAEKTKADLQETLKVAREVAGTAGIDKSADHFQTSGEGHRLEANKWLTRLRVAASILCGTALLFLALPLLKQVPGFAWIEYSGTEQTAQLLTSKLLILGALAYWLVLCSRNYSAHRHNEIVNLHRVNALKTFRALVAATGDQGKRDVVLAKAADCIFEHQESGYTKSVGAGEGPRQIVEFLQPKS